MKAINKLKEKFNSLNKFKSIQRSTYSFSQYGEDNIILLMLDLYDIKNIKFMDIGAFHPFHLSNTALLYKLGIRGINIEPDPIQFKKFVKYRKYDTNLNIGIHNLKSKMIFYMFEKPEFNTFSLEAALDIENKGIKKISETFINVDTYNNIVSEKLLGIPPDVLFLDAEGLDEIILESIDYEKFAPKIICVETFAYGVGVKNVKLINSVISNGYKLFADTFVNTLFIHNSISSNAIS